MVPVGGFQGQMFEEQDQYQQERSSAMQQVESTIVELGDMFTQLATMVQGLYLFLQAEFLVKIYTIFVEEILSYILSVHLPLRFSTVFEIFIISFRARRKYNANRYKCGRVRVKHWSRPFRVVEVLSFGHFKPLVNGQNLCYCNHIFHDFCRLLCLTSYVHYFKVQYSLQWCAL